MNGMQRSLAPLCGLLLLAGCGSAEPQRESAAETAVQAAWPLTTSSDEARGHLLDGVLAMDMGRSRDEAHERSQRAITADPNFAAAYLMAALTAPSFDQARENLQRAEQRAGGASEAERLLIDLEQKLFDNAPSDALAVAQQLVQVAGDNPRSWLVLGAVQSRLGDEKQARSSMARALQLQPNFVPAHLDLANSYVFVQPLDLAKGEEHVRRAIALAPDEAFPHDLQGDLRRAQGRLQDAAEAYTQASKLAPRLGGPLQQRGHVHLLLGNYDQARADYDAAAAREEGSLKAAWIGYRSLVPLFAGDPKGSLDELEQLIQSVDGMGVPNPEEVKGAGYLWQARIAIHHGYLDVAERAVAGHSAVLRRRAEQGAESFRRAQEASIAYLEGLLAIRKGDYALAERKAREIIAGMEPVRDPRKNERAHALMALAALRQGKHQQALHHFAQAHQLDSSTPQTGDREEIYVLFHRGLALEGAGRAAEAKEIYRTIAQHNFVTPAVGLVRRDALAKLKG